MRNLEEMGLITMGKEINEGGREVYLIYSITEKGKDGIH